MLPNIAYMAAPINGKAVWVHRMRKELSRLGKVHRLINIERLADKRQESGKYEQDYYDYIAPGGAVY